MALLTPFGAAAVSGMLVLYWFEPRSSWYSLRFGVGYVTSSVHSWLSGIRPLGVVEPVGARLAVVRWLQPLRAGQSRQAM